MHVKGEGKITVQERLRVLVESFGLAGGAARVIWGQCKCTVINNGNKTCVPRQSVCLKDYSWGADSPDPEPTPPLN